MTSTGMLPTSQLASRAQQPTGYSGEPPQWYQLLEAVEKMKGRQKEKKRVEDPRQPLQQLLNTQGV